MAAAVRRRRRVLITSRILGTGGGGQRRRSNQGDNDENAEPAPKAVVEIDQVKLAGSLAEPMKIGCDCLTVETELFAEIARPYAPMPNPSTTVPTAPAEAVTIRLSTLTPSPRGRRPGSADVACWLIPFALVIYLGMKRGGYEEPVRGQVGMIVWFVVAMGLFAYALPRQRITRWGWIGLGVLAVFAGWTALGVSWSSSSGRSVTEAARVLTYVGVLLLALLIGGRDRMRATIGAIAAGCAVIALIALLSRLHPQWFPADELARQLVGVQSRLRYPVQYWNALAGLTALGLPLIIWATVSARAVALRALAAAVVPAMALTIYFTYSRTGALAALVAIIAFVALSERRLALLPPLLGLGLISSLVIWQASGRTALVDNLGDATAHSQGTAMIAIVLGAGLLAAGLIWALTAGERNGRLPRLPAVPKRRAAIIAAAVAAVAVIGFLAIGGIGQTGEQFDNFKRAEGVADNSARLTSIGGNGRWQYWSAAVEAAQTDWLKGIGPGTYQFWWNEHRDYLGIIRDAHSLFIETLGELGIVGLLLIGGFCALILVLGSVRALRSAGERRGELAALTAAALVFVLAAGVDWLWELAVLPVAFLFVAAAILNPPREEEAGAPIGRRSEAALRIGGGLLALGAAALLYFPTFGATELAESQDDFRAGDLAGALAHAENAEDLQPYSAAPQMQAAFVHERAGELSRAATDARAAAEREPDNWEIFYLLSRIQAQRGKEGSALIAFRRAHQLNPLSPDLTLAP